MIVLDALNDAVAHHRRGNLPAAEAGYRYVLESDPANLQAHNNLGSVYQQQGRFEEAAGCFRRAVVSAPSSFAAHYNLGLAVHEAGQVVEAVEHYETALSFNAGHADVHLSLGNALQELGQLSFALKHYEAAIRLNPRHAEAQWNRAIVLLQSGDRARGWPAHEWRWQAAERPARPALQQPEWDGSPLRHKTLLVYGEQGVGDEIMFAHCLSDVVTQTGRCVIATAPRLERLFRRSFPLAEICSARNPADMQRIAATQSSDAHVAIGSLPRFVRPRLELFPCRIGYLQADRTEARRWRERLADLGDGLKIGLSWRAAVTGRERRKRATTLSQWQPILSVPSVQFVSLQHAAVAAEIKAEIETAERACGATIHQFADADPAGDLDDFAAFISALDLVITVGNTAAHLAGALGVPCWTLLPHAWGWRWLIGRDDSPWYPTMRLFRQRQLGDWDEAILRVAHDLKRLTA